MPTAAKKLPSKKATDPAGGALHQRTGSASQLIHVRITKAKLTKIKELVKQADGVVVSNSEVVLERGKWKQGQKPSDALKEIGPVLLNYTDGKELRRDAWQRKAK